MKLFQFMKTAVLPVSLLTVIAVSAYGDAGPTYPRRRPAVDPIWVGEKQELSVSFLGFTGLHVEIEVLPHDKIGPRKVYRVQAIARNSKLLGLFYDMDDLVETWVDYESLFSHRFHLVQRESKLSREAWENHDPAKGETIYKNTAQKKGENRENSQITAQLPKFAQDNFSSFLFLRSLPLEMSETYRIPVISEGNSMEVLATVEGVDMVKAMGKRQQGLQIKLEKIGKDGKPIPGQKNLVWLSNDDRRVLLRVDVTTRFGHVVGELKDYSPGEPPPAPPAPVASPSAI